MVFLNPKHRIRKKTSGTGKFPGSGKCRKLRMAQSRRHERPRSSRLQHSASFRARNPNNSFPTATERSSVFFSVGDTRRCPTQRCQCNIRASGWSFNLDVEVNLHSERSEDVRPRWARIRSGCRGPRYASAFEAPIRASSLGVRRVITP